MATVARLDTDEEIGYFVDLYGPLPDGNQGCFFDAWRYPEGSTRAQAPVPPVEAMPVKIWMPEGHPKRVDCVLLVTPTYLDFMRGHPAFRPLPPRPQAERRSWWRKRVR